MMGVKVSEGEKIELARRKRFWRLLLLAGIGGAPIGFAIGFALGKERGDLEAAWAFLPPWLVAVLVAIAILTVLIGSIRFVQAIDEVELQDNLWSSTAAYGCYALVLPAWWALGEAGLIPEVNHWIVYFLALGVGLAAYFYRKWAAR